jgi:hypothetical protein
MGAGGGETAIAAAQDDALMTPGVLRLSSTAGHRYAICVDGPGENIRSKMPDEQVNDCY